MRPRTGEGNCDEARLRELEIENGHWRRKAEALAEELLAMKGEMQARMFLLIAAFVVGGRAVLVFWEPGNYSLSLDALFAAVVLVLLGMWIWTGWKELHWMLVPYLVVVFDAAFLSVFYRPAVYALIGAFLFGATRTCEVAFARILVVLEGLYERKA